MQQESRGAMDTGEHKDFDKEAAQWDAKPERIKLANDVANAIIREAGPLNDVNALDFGCGTGLLTLMLQPHVKSITGVDSSMGMLEVLRGKIKTQGLGNVYAMFVNFEKGVRIQGAYDLIVSSMTIHHVQDTAALFRQWYALLMPGGKVFFSDLDAEGGSFHSDNTGVFHYGFDRAKLKTILHTVGYRDIRDTTASTIIKEVAEGATREFPVFLISAKK
jgi:2-polyprenyl-3-methyl-5-hydroxy-6-metoxy-1,4-benzoquinol methylase